MSILGRLLRKFHCTPCLVVAVTTTLATCDGDYGNGESGDASSSKRFSKGIQRFNHIVATSASSTREGRDHAAKTGLIGAVGNTPLIYIRSASEATGCHVYGKAEFMNPTASVKDRAAKYLIEEAEKNGNLQPGGTLVEGTGGNTGVALAHLGASRGYKVVLCMPNSISVEKINHQRRLGAEVHLQPLVPFSDPENYARKAEIIAKERADQGAFFTNQFENEANFNAHYNGTGPEIWVQTRGKIDGFITSAGTGGTIGGISACLKNLNPKIKTYLVDPRGSVLYSYVTTGKCEVGANSGNAPAMEGIGIARITANMSKAVLDGAFTSRDQEAVDMAYHMLKQDGIYVGPSAALNVTGAVKLARKMGPGHTIVTVLCDSGDRYVSKLYNDDWLAENNLTPSPGAVDDKSLSFIKCGNPYCACGQDCSCVDCNCGKHGDEHESPIAKDNNDNSAVLTKTSKKDEVGEKYEVTAIDVMPTRKGSE